MILAHKTINRAQRFSCNRALLFGFLMTLFVLAGKWWLVDRFAGEIPYADQWGAEGEIIYRPLLRGEWSWDNLLRPWNEHRIVFTRIMDVLIFKVAGNQWDPTVQLALNAAIFAIWLGLAVAWAAHRMPRARHGWLCLVAAAGGVLPFAFENTLSAFQSSFYFLLLFSTVAGWGLLSFAPGKTGWWIGLLAGLLAVFSLASGGIASGAVLTVLTMRSIKQRRVSYETLFTGLAAAAILVVAWIFRVDVAAHEKIASNSWMGFSVAWFRVAGWPFSNMALATVVWAPFTVFVIRILKSRLSVISPMAEMILFLGIWVIAQIAAMAWLRGTPLTFLPPASRYTDILAAGLMANFLALCSQDFPAAGSRWINVVRAAWVFAVGMGLMAGSAAVATKTLGAWREGKTQEKDQIALFLRTGTTSALARAEQLDHEARLVQFWTGKQIASLPPALQSRPPDGFEFSQSRDWQEGGFAASLEAPGGYAVWGDWLNGNSKPVAITSLPFALKRSAITFSYAMSPDWGRCEIQFLTVDGSVIATFLALHTPGGDPSWREALLRLPPGTYRLRIYDHREGGKFAITSPREMSLMGYGVRLLLADSEFLLFAAGIGLVTALAWPERHPPER